MLGWSPPYFLYPHELRKKELRKIQHLQMLPAKWTSTDKTSQLHYPIKPSSKYLIPSSCKDSCNLYPSYDKVFLPEIQMLHEKPVETPRNTRKSTKFTDGSRMSLSTVCSIRLQEKNKNLKEKWPAVTHISFMCKFIQHSVYYWVTKGADWEL